MTKQMVEEDREPQSSDKNRDADDSRSGRLNDSDECRDDEPARSGDPCENRGQGGSENRGESPRPNNVAELAGDGFSDPD